jgi:transglutaminase-like putative cysteine protease
MGLALTAARPVGGAVLPAVLLAQLLLLALVRATETDPIADTGYRSTRAALGRFALGVPLVLVLVAAGIAGARYLPVASGTDRFDLRDVVPVQLDVGDTITPLAGLKSQLREPSRPVFTVRLGGDWQGVDRVRTAALDSYDGSLWTSSDRFLLAGSALPANESITDQRLVTLEVTIDELPGPYLPALGWPVRMDAPRFGFSEDSGVLATDTPSTAGLHYNLVAQLGPAGGLDNAVPELAASTKRYTELPPGMPPEIRLKATELASEVSQPYAKLLAIQDYLQGIAYSLDARPGHSYDALSRLFSTDPVDRVGYAEQFAAAFAVLARSQGFPARVAVGYLLREDEREADTYAVTTVSAHAWAEVNLTGYGWVPFEPTDPQRRAGTVAEPPEQEAGQRQPQPDDEATASQPGEDPTLPVLTSGRAKLLDWALWVLIALAVLVALTPVAVAAEKLRRRRRRRSGGRATRVVGAWQEAMDRLVAHGITISAAQTVNEVAYRARLRFGDSAGAVVTLAPLVTRALYSPVEPDDATVRQAWLLDSKLGRDLRKARGALVTVRSWIDPRPLFARRRDARRRRRTLDQLTRG